MSMPIEIKTIDKDKYTLTMVASTQDVDRHGDVVIQSGWDLRQFKKNPVILNSHNYGDVTEVIARATRSEIVGSGKSAKLEQDWEFAVKENPKAKIAFDLYAGGFLSASSVGFIPTKFKQNKDGSTDYYTIEEAELLEVSAVSVPANARALAKAKGIDVDVLEVNNETNNDEPNNEDTTEEPEGDSNEVPKDSEVPPADGETTPGDSDDSESEPEKSDEGPGDATGSETGAETLPDESGETPDAGPVQASYASKVAKAINLIESKEKEQYRKVANIIDSLLKGDETAPTLQGREQIRKRKTNQAIRMLLKMK